MGSCCFTPRKSHFLWWYWLALATVIGAPMLLAAWYVANRVDVPRAGRPFLIVFGDATMHPSVSKRAIKGITAQDVKRDVDAVGAWKEVAQKWNTWFLRRPTGRKGDNVDRQWSSALGPYKGGTRFHASTTLDGLKLLAFEQTFKAQRPKQVMQSNEHRRRQSGPRHDLDYGQLSHADTRAK